MMHSVSAESSSLSSSSSSKSAGFLVVLSQSRHYNHYHHSTIRSSVDGDNELSHGNNKVNDGGGNDRRSFLWKSTSRLVCTSLVTETQYAHLANAFTNDNVMDPSSPATTTTSKPTAPLGALLPAIRVKKVIDRSIVLTSKLVDSSTPSASPSDTLQELSDLLLMPQNYTRSTAAKAVKDIPQRPSQQYIDSYDRQRQNVPLWGKPGAYLVQQGEIDSWKRLKRQEANRENQDEIRAALNEYTTNLNFNADAYMLTAPKEERSKLIRSNALPDVKTVITSDMGIRYLYRNEILSTMEDARAELQYQISLLQEAKTNKDQNDGSSSVVDASELLRLLQDAQKAFDRWLDLIDSRDVQAAIDALET